MLHTTTIPMTLASLLTRLSLPVLHSQDCSITGRARLIRTRLIRISTYFEGNAC